MLGHETHLNKSKRIEIILCLLSDHNEIKLEISNRKITDKKDHQICCFQNTHRSSKDKHRANSEGMEDNTPSKFSQKKVGITILISDKIDFKAKKVTKDKNGQYIMIKGKIHQEDITVINIYAPKMGARKYIK